MPKSWPVNAPRVDHEHLTSPDLPSPINYHTFMMTSSRAAAAASGPRPWARNRPGAAPKASRHARSVAARALESTGAAIEQGLTQQGGQAPTLRPVVFSAKGYVHDFLELPLTSAFPEARFLEVRAMRQAEPRPACCPGGGSAIQPPWQQLPPHPVPQPRLGIKTAKLAKGSDAVVIFVNDDCSEPVSQASQPASRPACCAQQVLGCPRPGRCLQGEGEGQLDGHRAGCPPPACMAQGVPA
jgi:hypothetical protein